LAQVLIGMIVGAMVAVHEQVANAQRQPFAQALLARAQNFHAAFWDVVGAPIYYAYLKRELLAARWI